MGLLDLVSRIGLARFKRERTPDHAKLNGKANGHVCPIPRLRWDDQPEAERIITAHYPTKRPEIIAAMLAPLFPEHIITRNMVIGRAHRLGLRKDKRASE